MSLSLVCYQRERERQRGRKTREGQTNKRKQSKAKRATPLKRDAALGVLASLLHLRASSLLNSSQFISCSPRKLGLSMIHAIPESDPPPRRRCTA
eukprot:scaffold183_cov249-Pinguiococcus_pyrenoidosus.AAC.11